jgi:hypothetical protein
VRVQPMCGMLGAVLISLLCGCAASTQSTAAAEQPDPDCSFRSPTTCWTMAGRFPPVRSKPSTAPVDPRDSSTVLASGADSAQSSR